MLTSHYTSSPFRGELVYLRQKPIMNPRSTRTGLHVIPSNDNPFDQLMETKSRCKSTIVIAPYRDATLVRCGAKGFLPFSLCTTFPSQVCFLAFIRLNLSTWSQTMTLPSSTNQCIIDTSEPKLCDLSLPFFEAHSQSSLACLVQPR